MGAGAFAAPVLSAVHGSSSIDLIGTATQPDRIAGRKRILTPTPLGLWADAHGIPCQRVSSVNSEEYLNQLRALAPDLIVVVSFGQILKQPLLDLPRLGCLNVHASILPKYRGASPIASSILNGDTETGITFMQMERGLDSGPIYKIIRAPITNDVTTETLEQTLAGMAGREIESVLLGIANASMQPVPQPVEGVSVVTKIHKNDGSIDWNEDAFLIERKIRAYAKWPNTRFCLNHGNKLLTVKITKASATSYSTSRDCGTVLSLPEKRHIMVQCGNGALLIDRVLPEGKKEMAVSDFLNGVKISVGTLFLNGPDKLPPQDT